MREGYTQRQAGLYAGIGTASELLTEKLLGGLTGVFTKKSDFEKTLSHGLQKVLKNKTMNDILSKAGSEGMEEFVQEYIDGFSRKIVLKEENNVFSKETFLNAMYSSLVGALSSGASESFRQYNMNSDIRQMDQLVYDIERTSNRELSQTNKTILENKFYEHFLENDGVVDINQVKFDYLKDKQIKISRLNKSANKYFDSNSDKTKAMLNSLSRFIEDKNYDIIFDKNIGDNINGVNIDGNTIKINPKTENAIEKIAMHEVTHSISTDKLRALVMDYASNHEDFQKALKALKKTYRTQNVSDEVLADISGQLFGNQEFISMLKNNESNTFKKLYNGIISVANQLTGNKNKSLFVQDLKNKWHEAYRSSDNNHFKKSVYSIEHDKKFGDYWKIETEKDLFSGTTDRKSLQKKAYNYLLNGNNNFETITDIIDGKEIKFIRISANEYLYGTNSKKLNTDSYNQKMRIVPSIDDLINNAEVNYYSPRAHKSTTFKDGFNNYQGKLGIDNNLFRYIVRVGKKTNDNIFYDISLENLGNIKGTAVIVPGTNSTSLSKNAVPSNADNIPQFDSDVKSDISSTKYSMQESENLSDNKWANYVDDNYSSEGTKTYSEDIKKITSANNEIPKDPTKESSYETKTRKTASIYEKKEIDKRVEDAVRKNRYKAIDEATEAGQRKLDFTREEKKSFKENLDKFVGLTQEKFEDVKVYKEIQKIVENYANKELIFEDNELKNLKKEIRQYRFKLDEELRKSITDFSDFRKRNFGKIIFSQNGDNIDSIYQELSHTYPQYFQDEIYSKADMLEIIENLVNKDTRFIDTYRIDQSSLTDATREVIQKLRKGLMNEQDIENLQNHIEEKALARTREVVYNEYIDQMGLAVEDLETGEDTKMISLSRLDPRRAFEEIFDKKTSDLLNKQLTDSIEHNEKLKNDELTRLRDEVKALGIKVNSKEDAAVQKYVEGYYIDKYGDYREYNDHTLMSEFPNIEDQKRIKKAAKYFEKIYPSLAQTYNNILTENGYRPMELRKKYMPHMEEKGDILSKIGFSLSPQTLKEDSLPTDINGLTEEFKPGKKYFSHAQRRTGEKTIYSALRGFDEYIEGWGNVVYHTEDIQKRRAIAKLVRDTWGPTNGTSNENFIGLADIKKVERISDIQRHKLSNFAAWIDEQANFIAGKKGKLDRAIESRAGRKVYTVLKAAKKQVGSNMVGFNLRSPLTNFASTVQAFSKTNPIDTLRGYASTMFQVLKKDDLISKSDFLTNRLNSSEKIYQKFWDKASSLGQTFMGATDWVTTNMIYRSKYSECLRKGMSESEALRTCDDFTARIMGNHTIGTTASLFNDQTLGLVTQFQLEVNNYWSTLWHDNKMLLKDDKVDFKGKIAALVWQAGTLAGLSNLFNSLITKLTGSDVMLDFVELFKTIFVPDDDDEEKTFDERIDEAFGDIWNQLPFVSFVTGGRIPVSEAFKGGTTLLNKWTNKTDNYGNKVTWNDVKNDTLDSLGYWILPAGKSQINKTYKGLQMYNPKLPVSGSYTDSGNLRFTADKSLPGKTKAILFGQYSSKDAQDYINSGYKSIQSSKIDEMKSLGMNSTDYRKWQKDFKEATKTDDTNGYKIYFDSSGNKYYYDDDNNILYNSKYEKSNKDIDSLTKVSSTELKFNYISKSKLSEANKKVLFKNALKSDKDFDDYDDYSSYEEFKYAKKQPKKYDVITQITTYDKYQKYKDRIDEIKKNESKSSIRKLKVIEYINSLNLNISQKAMLIRTEYKSFNNYNKNIVEYVQKQRLSKESKENILKELGFKVDKGKVYYK